MSMLHSNLEVGIDMKLNNRGMSMVEIMASLVLISIVLIFLMNIFLNVRTTYNNSTYASDYEMLKSNIIKAVGEDINNFGLKDITCIDEYTSPTTGVKSCSKVILTFNEFRKTNLSENIVKVLNVYMNNDKYYVSYGYDANYTEYITSVERLTFISREVPDNVIMSSRNGYITYTNKKLAQNQYGVRISVPLYDNVGNVYSINIYGIIEN